MRRSESSAARWTEPAGPPTRVGGMDTRTRWIVGILIALVIGLGVALIIVAADDSGSTGTTSSPRTATLTEATSTRERSTR